MTRHRRIPPALISSVALALMACAPAPVASQTLDFGNLQVHGYATQGFLYTTNNNWATTNSSDGSAAWTEAVVSLTAQPESRLRIGAQTRYSLLGDYGNKITLDWAQADYKVNEFFGIRAGKVKTPTGLFNDIQDVGPSYLWILLPQSVYPLPSRNSTLAHFGGVVYGSIPLGELAGKLEYRGFGGERVVAGDDGYFSPVRDGGLVLPNGLSGPVSGGSLRWKPAVQGLLFGAADAYGHESGAVSIGPVEGTLYNLKHQVTYFFARYDRSRLSFAGEFNRQRLNVKSVFPVPSRPDFPVVHDSFYVMARYRTTGKLETGLYYSSDLDREASTSSARYQKDWALSARYDFSPSLYAKFEQHFMDGTSINYSAYDNPNLKPNTRMTLLKLGVSF